MKSSSSTTHPAGTDAQACLARSVAEAISNEPTLEAVTIDRTNHTISVATLGRSDVVKLSARIQEKVAHVQNADPDHSCSLLTGTGNCSTCSSPLTNQELQRVSIRHQADTTTIARVTCPTAPTFWRWFVLPFPKVVQREVEFLEHDHEVDEWKAQLVAAALCGVTGIAGYLFTHFAHPSLGLAGYIAAYLAGAWYPAVEVWERLEKRTIDVHFLMLAVAAGSASIGALGEGATLLFLFSFSGALEHYALGRTQKEIRSLFREAPKVATVIDPGGSEREMAVDQLQTGLRLLVRPGAQFPVDAEVVKGGTAADESNLTGEATPVEKRAGDTALAGTINLWGAVEVLVLRPAEQSALQKIIRLIQEAQRRKAPAQRFADRFSTYYTYGILGASLAMFFVWWVGFGLAPFTSAAGSSSAFYRTMTLLVVASPCALVLSIPSAVLAAIAWGARHGILIRGGAAVEKLADVDIVALDKTGTLTTGELRVEEVQSFPPGRENEVATLAYSLERLSNHPLARAITRYGRQQSLIAIEMTGFESVTGHGLKAQHGDSPAWLGRRDWIESLRPMALTSEPATANVGFSEIWVAHGDLTGRIVLRDDIRAEAGTVLKALKSAGLRTLVLTGDRQSAADHLKQELPLDEVRAELKPEEKVAAIQSLSKTGRVAMIGDGVNDAPSLAAAHVGVAMGARGADAALEQADVVLMHDRLENFLGAYQLSRRAQRIIRQNLFVSLGTVVVLVVFALLGRIPLPVGVVGHEGSTVIVVMNSLRLLMGGKTK